MTDRIDIERISDRAVLERHLEALVRADVRLAPVLAAAGEVPLRLRPGGFAGLAQIVTSQLLSVASAKAIHARVEQVLGEVSAARLREVDDQMLREAGLSFGKIAALRAIGQAELSGELDYEALGAMPAEAALARLRSIKGIGRWSGEIYLLFCTGHPDIFASGDLALRKAVSQVFGQVELDEKAVRGIARGWSPWRGAAARLMWRHYALMKSREGVL